MRRFPNFFVKKISNIEIKIALSVKMKMPAEKRIAEE